MIGCLPNLSPHAEWGFGFYNDNTILFGHDMLLFMSILIQLNFHIDYLKVSQGVR